MLYNNMTWNEADSRQKIVQMIRDLKPDVDVIQNKKLASSGIFESFDILVLVGNIYEIFNIEIEAEDILPENFESIDTILALLKKYTK